MQPNFEFVQFVGIIVYSEYDSTFIKSSAYCNCEWLWFGRNTNILYVVAAYLGYVATSFVMGLLYIASLGIGVLRWFGPISVSEHIT